MSQAQSETPKAPPGDREQRAPAGKGPVPLEPIPTRQIAIEIGEGRALDFTVADGMSEPPCFCLGVRKSGSTMLNRIVTQLARRNRYHGVDIPGTFFRNGYRVQHWEAADLSSLILPGNIYLGFRNFPTSFQAYPAFRSAPKIFMFRDPRDALVSQYFSDAYSHSIPKTNTEQGRQGAAEFTRKREEALGSDIDTYVIKHARGMDNTLGAYADMLDDPTCLKLRYEEYVFQKRRLIFKILQHYGWTCLPGQIEAVLKIVDEVPESEDKTRFVRRVIPGDHRNKLRPETIARLNNILRESMHAFDYY